MRDVEHPMFNYYNQISAYLLSLWAHFFHAQYIFWQMPCFVIVILIEVPHRQIQVKLLNRIGNDNIAVDYWCSKMQQKPFPHSHRKLIYVKLVKSWIKIYRYAQSTVKTPFLSFAFIPSYYIWLWRVLNIILPIDLYIHFNNAENILWHIKKL